MGLAEASVEVLEKLLVPADRITELYKAIENVKKQVADQEHKLDTRSQGCRTVLAVEIRSMDSKRSGA